MVKSFHLSERITNNILKAEKSNFISENKLTHEYSREGKSFHQFVSDCVNQGVISRMDVENFLFESLFYGYQREVYIYQVASCNENCMKPEIFLNILQDKYEYIDDCAYSNIANMAADDEKLVAVKTIYTNDLQRIAKIQLIFKTEVSILRKGGIVKTLSYIPVDWDVNSQILSIKFSPKRHVFDKEKQPERLKIHFIDQLKEMFNIQFIPFGNIHKEALCEMSKSLYRQIYEKMVCSKPQNLDSYVEEISDGLKKVLGVEALELKATGNNIFNIKDNIQKFTENILISDILLGAKEGATLEGVEGVVTYLKFSDGKKISARLKGRECREPIFGSESYMALRSAIENARRVNRLEVVWLGKFDRLRITYEAAETECLTVHFYKNLKEEEYKYGLQMFRKFERYGNGKLIKAVEMESQAQ